MADKHMKRCSISLTIERMQVKSIMSYYFTPVRIGKIKATDHIRYELSCRTTGILIIYWWEYKMVHPVWKNLAVSYKVKIHLPFDSHLGFYPSEMKIYVHTKQNKKPVCNVYS